LGKFSLNCCGFKEGIFVLVILIRRRQLIENEIHESKKNFNLNLSWSFASKKVVSFCRTMYIAVIKQINRIH
jgi:hypothetical protein